MAKCEKILIAGFSGAGKSTLLQAIQAQAPQGWERFDDLDQLLFEHHRQEEEQLSQLIDLWGWELFRQNERRELTLWLELPGKGVLSLGGGTLTPHVWQELAFRPEVGLVFLDADFESCWRRLENDTVHERPLVKKGREALRHFYQERRVIYERIPRVLKNPEGTDISALAQEFWSLWPHD